MSTVYVIPILHPAFVLKGQWGQEPYQICFLKNAKEIAERGYEPRDIHAPPVEDALLYPTVAQYRDWLAGIDSTGVSLDIENAGPHLVMLGLCRVCDLVPITLRFRKCGGDVWPWTYSELTEIVGLTFDLLADASVPKVMQNGASHDIPFLETLGFTVKGYSFDTMLASYIAYPEAPKRLPQLASVYASLPNWKVAIRDEAEAEEK